MPWIDFAEVEDVYTAEDFLAEMRRTTGWLRQKKVPALVLIAEEVERALHEGDVPWAFYFLEMGLIIYGSLETLVKPESRCRFLRVLMCAERELAQRN